MSPGVGKVLVYTQDDVKDGEITAQYFNPEEGMDVVDVIVSEKDVVTTTLVPNSLLEKCSAVYKVIAEEGAYMKIGDETMHLENGYYVFGNANEPINPNEEQMKDVVLPVGTGAVTGKINANAIELYSRIVQIEPGSEVKVGDKSFEVDGMTVQGTEGTVVTLNEVEEAKIPVYVKPGDKVHVEIPGKGIEGETDRANIVGEGAR